jgi:hypothetical protein
VIWKGPIVDQDGKEVLSAGAAADDRSWPASTSSSAASSPAARA